MKARHAMLVALAAAFVLTTVAVAGPDASRQRVMITTQAGQTTSVSPFVLITLQTGSLKGDSGKMIGGPSSGGGSVMREGQEASIQEVLTTLKGKRGTLVFRYRAEWVEAGNGYDVATSTWKVVRGTGQYAGITGGGRGASVWHERTDDWSSRMEGFLTLP